MIITSCLVISLVSVKDTVKVLNDIVECLDNKQHYDCLFIDLSKAFDTVDHNILLDRLRWIGLSEHVCDSCALHSTLRESCTFRL